MKKYTVIAHNPTHAGQLDLLPHIVYAAPDGEPLALQLIKPRWHADGQGFPLVVFIQGSGWTKPKQFWQLPQLSRLAQRGFVIASVTHRSCAAAPAPAFLQDVKCAIRFLRAHAADYAIDKTRVCAWGTSSGGNTALLLGLTADDPRFETADCAGESTRVQAVVDCFGPTDLLRMAQVQYKEPDTDLNERFRKLGGGETIDACLSALRSVSPIAYAQPGRDYPPFLVLHGDADPVVRYEDSVDFVDAMDACGYDMELVRVTDAPHEGTFWSDALLEHVFDFVTRTLKA